MLRIIREVEPSKPSTRLQESDESARVAKQRGTNLGALRGELRGDLDWIIMKALDKDRARRYGTATELAADLRRHLTHEPVLAGAPSASYRLQKFARKHRALLSAAALVFVALSASMA